MGWLIAGLILFSLMVLAEKALLAITPHELDMLRAEGTPSARRVVAIYDGNDRRALAAVLLARMFVLVGIVVGVLNYLFRLAAVQDLFSQLEQKQGIPFAFAQPVFALMLVAGISFILWRISQLGLRRPQWPIAGFWLQRLGPLVGFALFVFAPFLPKKQNRRKEASVPAQQAPVAQDSGLRDLEILKSIAKFGDVTVRQVMQPQSRIVAIDKSATFGEVLSTIRATDFSRLPVYEDSLDNVVGTLYVKDIVDAIDAPPEFEWVSRLRPEVFIVPETKPVSEVFREFKLRKLHLALVVDEYGGTAGLVTMEDILEEITGEIRDEFDEENEIPPFNQLDINTFLFNGTTMINDVCHIAGLDPDTFETVRDDADTIAGLVLNLMGEIPAPGQNAQWGQYRFTVEKSDNRRVEEVRLEIIHDNPPGFGT